MNDLTGRPLENRLPGVMQKQGGDGTELTGTGPVLVRKRRCMAGGKGAFDRSHAGARERKQGLLRHENSALDFHGGPVAIAASDIVYLCTKITFSAFENSSSK